MTVTVAYLIGIIDTTTGQLMCARPSSSPAGEYSIMRPYFAVELVSAPGASYAEAERTLREIVRTGRPWQWIQRWIHEEGGISAVAAVGHSVGHGLAEAGNEGGKVE